MNKLLLTSAILGTALFSQNAQAQGFLDRLESTMSKVESTITRTENSVDRAQSTAERLNDKMPESGAEEPAETVTFENAPAPHATPSTMTQEEEDAILEQARKIEEERILREAEKIRAQRGYR